MPVRIAIDICGNVNCSTPTLQQVLPQRRRTESASATPCGGNDAVTISVTVPSLVDGPQANVLADILITQVDTVVSNASFNSSSSSNDVAPFVSSLRLQKLAMTPEGTHGVLLFLAIHAHTIAQVSFQHLIQVNGGDAAASDGDAEGDEDADLAMLMMARIAEALVSAPLEKLALAHLTLLSSTSIWQYWNSHSQLGMLKLDRCVVNDASLQDLYEQLTCWKSLQDLYVVLVDTQLSNMGLDAADKILTACSHGKQTLSSLRWVYRYSHVTSSQPAEFGTPSNKFPITGLRELVAKNTLLKQLVLEGCLLNDHEIGQLCSVVSELKDLRNLKLRNLQLTNAHAQTIARALYQAQAPIVNMDWSGNMISQSGLQSILDLVATLTTSIQSLFLNSNQLTRECFNMVIDFLQVNQLADIDLRIQYNPYDAERIAPLLALALWEAERDRDKALKSLRDAQDQRDKAQKDLERANRSDSSRFLKLEQENGQLKDELETMIRAFGIMGSRQGVEDQLRLQDRISRLEDVLGGISRQPSGRSSRQGSGNSRDLGSRQSSSQNLVPLRQVSGRDLGTRQESNRDLVGSGDWQVHPHDVVIQTPQSIRRPIAPNLMETPREDRQPAMPIQTKSPDTLTSTINKNTTTTTTSTRQRRPPSVTKSADAGLLNRMQRSGSSRRVAEGTLGDDTKAERLRLTSSRRPNVTRSASSSTPLEDGSPQAEVLTNISGHGSGSPRWIAASDQGSTNAGSGSRRPNATGSTMMHQSYNGFSTVPTWETDNDRVNQSYNGFSGNWELDDVKETPYEDTEKSD